MYLFIFISLVIVTLQIILALASKLLGRKLESKYGMLLGSQMNAAELLENYVKIYQQNLNIKVDANIKKAAEAGDNYIKVNKSQIYNADLFTTVMFVKNLLLASSKFRAVREAKKLFEMLFVFSLIFIITAILLPVDDSIRTVLAIIGLSFQIVSIILLFWVIFKSGRLTEKIIEVGKDLLDLDEIELIHARELSEETRYKFLDFPFTAVTAVLKRVVFFVVPVRRGSS